MAATSLTPFKGSTAAHQSLENAVAGFQAVLSDEERQKLQDMKNNDSPPDADTVLVFTASLDSMSRQRRGRSISTRLHSFLLSVGGFCNIMTDGKLCNIADTFVSSNPEIAALVWGTVKLAMIVSLRA